MTMTSTLPPAVDLMAVNWGTWQEAFLSEADARKLPAALREDKIMKNRLFQVNIKRILVDESDDRMAVLHLSVKLISKEAFHDWRVFQRIKNELVGEEFEAVEIYPPESQLVDTANQYHLWVLPEGMRLPFGFRSGRIVSDGNSRGAKQRAFAPGHRPADCLTAAELDAKVDSVLLK